MIVSSDDEDDEDGFDAECGRLGSPFEDVSAHVLHFNSPFIVTVILFLAVKVVLQLLQFQHASHIQNVEPFGLKLEPRADCDQ